MSAILQPAIFSFLQDLRENNDRDWFNANKPIYQEQLANFKAFANEVLDHLSTHDEIEQLKVFRIYRDVRFSKDKSPYKTNFSAGFTRATKFRRGGCFLSVEPEEVFVAGGFWAPESADLKRIRKELAADAQPLRDIIAETAFVDTFGELAGNQLKSAPAGYPKDHPNIDLLRYKQYLLTRRFTIQAATQAGFAQTISDTFATMRPFFDYMTDVLTTDENGVPIE
ncbi:MAG: DUF2461 domain-containing protein [Bacteroidota bacterium]